MSRSATRPLRQRLTGPLLAAIAAVHAGFVAAEPPAPGLAPLSRAYGLGVHAYFGGDYQRAYDDLTGVIEGGSQDPRAWYFRGLAALKLGRLDEAEADFSLAADREAEAAANWGVSRSLERVQGHDRLALERHRVRARVAALQERARAAQRRYVDDQRRQPQLLRRIRPEGSGGDPLGMFTAGSEEGGDLEQVAPPPAADDADSADAEGPPDDEAELPAEEPEAERAEGLPAEAPGDDLFGN